MSYLKLDESRNEIRLVTLLPSSTEQDGVNCTLETQSLEDLTPEHLEFLSTPEVARLSDRKAILEWNRRHFDSDVEQPLHHASTSTEGFRFLWGDYAALSYAWEKDVRDCPITVNGRVVHVTSNLERALRSFRDNGAFRSGMKLWIDAISINQRDFDERGQQIKRMREIYGRALTVISWLGGATSDSLKAIQLVNGLAEFGRDGRGKDLEDLLRRDNNYFGRGSWLALERLMRRHYWYRLWVVQEVVLGASSVTLRCGPASISWRTFCKGLMVLKEHLWVLKDDLLALDMIIAQLIPQAWATTSLHHVTEDLSKLCNNEENSGERLGYERFLDIAHSANCRDPRDKVYGLVGLMNSDVASRLNPNYSMEPARVYAVTTKTFIEVSRSLDPLRESNPWGPTRCPSWAADLQWDGRVRYSRIENSLWVPRELFGEIPPSILSSPHVQYHASGSSASQAVFANYDLLLECGGFVIDTVSTLSARGQGYFNWAPDTIVQPGPFHSAYGDYKSLEEALYRTLTLDRVWKGEKASSRHASIFHLPSTFNKAGPQFERLGWNWLSKQEGYYFRYAEWREANREFWVGDHRIVDFFTDKIPWGASEYDTTEAYACFDRTCKKRRLITTGKGYIGWAPDNIYGTDEDQTRRGDLIAILFGCSTPIIIRPKGIYFQVIGEAYVQGVMEGEAMAFLEDGTYRFQKFVFC